MDNNNLFNQGNTNGESGQNQYQPQQPYMGGEQNQYQQQPYMGGEQNQYQQQPYMNGEQNQYQQSYQQPYQQPYQQNYQQQQPYQSNDSELEEPVSFADWMVTTLIMCIPCLNIIMMFVWAFGSGTKRSKSNYFKAMLVWALISIVLMIILIATYGAVFFSILGSGSSYY